MVVEVAKDDKETVVVEEKVKTPKRRKRFISLKEFDQLAQNPPMGWTVLKRDCIYKLDDLDKLDGRAAATLTDHQGHPYRVFVPTAILKIMYNKLASESSMDKDVEVYLRPKKDEQADIAVKETFPCQKDCNEEFHSKHGRWLHHKHCAKTDI